MMTFRSACRPTSMGRMAAQVLSLSAVLLASTPSHAIPVPVPIQDQIYFESIEFTSGSVIVGQLTCYTELCSAEALRFTDGSGVILNGQDVDVSATLGADYFGWLPDTPPAPGTYRVDLITGTLAGIVQIEIVEASAALPTISFLLNNYSSVTGERIDCTEIASTATPQGFYEQALYQVAVVAAVLGENASQYIFDLRLAGDEVNRFMGRSLARGAEGEPSEVCVEVFARPVIGGDDISLAAECLSTDGLTFGVVEETNSGMPSALRLCTVPPDGYFEEWCAAFADQFAAESCAGTHPEACIAARTQCPEGDHPTDEEIDEVLNGSGGAGTGGDLNDGTGSTASGATGSMGENSGGGSIEEDPNSLPGDSSGSDEGSSSDTGGCSVAPRGGSSAGAWWFVLGMGLLVAGSRRSFKRFGHPGSRTNVPDA